MDEKLIKNLYASIVEDNNQTYRKLFNELEIEDDFIDYWKNALILYKSFDENEREVFFSIINTVIVDTVSTVFGILDGAIGMVEGTCDFTVTANGTHVEGELQDSFLAYVEEMEAEK